MSILTCRQRAVLCNAEGGLPVQDDAARQRRLQVPAGARHHCHRWPARLRQWLVERLACSAARHTGGGCNTRLVQGAGGAIPTCCLVVLWRNRQGIRANRGGQLKSAEHSKSGHIFPPSIMHDRASRAHPCAGVAASFDANAKVRD